MKITTLLVILQVFISLCGSAGEKSVYSAGLKQELLSPDAALAIEGQDIDLLERILAAGWDPTLPLGRMPDPNNRIKYTPLTFSTVNRAEKSMAWLLTTCKVSLDAMDIYQRRAIDVAIDSKVPDDHAVINLLKRDIPANESDALAELAYKINWKSGRRMKLQNVNDKKPDALWRKFDERILRIQINVQQMNTLISGSDAPEVEQTKLAAMETNTEEVDNLNIKWKRIDETTYKFSFITSDKSMSGGGMSGLI